MRSRQAALGALLLGGLVGGVAVADGPTRPRWQHLTPRPHPAARAGAAAAWDPVHHELVLFGGWTGRSTRDARALADTWTWEGHRWRLLHPAVAPPARVDAVLGWDGHELVLFGGLTRYGGGAWFNDTWVWNGSTWRQVRSDVHPSSRAAAGAAYDGSELLLFGGWNAHDRSSGAPAGELGDTWTFHGGRWRQQRPAAHPTPRRTPFVVDDPARGGAVLYGGESTSFSNDTWLYRRGAWTRVAPSCTRAGCPPAVVAGLALTPDGLPLLYAGHGTEQLWRLGGSTWQPVAVGGTTPPARRGNVFVAEPGHDAVLLFGGATTVAGPQQPYADTWQLAFPSGTGSTTAPVGPRRSPLPAPAPVPPAPGPPAPAPRQSLAPTARPSAVPSAAPTTTSPGGTPSPSGQPSPSPTLAGPRATGHHHEEGVPVALSVLAVVMLGAAGFATWLVRSRRLL